MPPFHSAADLFGAGDVLVNSAPAPPSGPPWSSLADPANDNEAFFTSLALAPPAASSTLASSDPFSITTLSSVAPAPIATPVSSEAPARMDQGTSSSSNTTRSSTPASSPLATSNTSSAPSTTPSSPAKSTVDDAAAAVASAMASLSLTPAAVALVGTSEDSTSDAAIPFESSSQDDGVSSLFASSSADLFGNGNGPLDFFQHQQQHQAQPSQDVFSQHAATTTSSHHHLPQQQERQQQQYSNPGLAPTLFSTQTLSVAPRTTSVTAAPGLVPTPAPENNNNNDHPFFDTYSHEQGLHYHQQYQQQQPHQSHPSQLTGAAPWVEEQQQQHDLFANSNAFEFSNFSNNNDNNNTSSQTSSEQTQQQQQHEHSQAYFDPYRSKGAFHLPTTDNLHSSSPLVSPPAVASKTPSPPSPPPHEQQPSATAQYVSAPMATPPTTSTPSASTRRGGAARHRYPTFDQQSLPAPQQQCMNPYEQTPAGPDTLSWQGGYQGTTYQQQQYGSTTYSPPSYYQQTPTSNQSSASADPFLSLTGGHSFFARVGSSVTSTLAYTSNIASERLATASTKIAGLWHGQHSQQHYQSQHTQQQQGEYYSYGQQQQQQSATNATLSSMSAGVTSINTNGSYSMSLQQQHEYGLASNHTLQQQSSYYGVDQQQQQQQYQQEQSSYPYGASQQQQQQQQQQQYSSHATTRSNVGGAGFSVATISEAAAKAGSYLPSLPNLSSVPLLNKLSKHGGPQLPSMYTSSAASSQQVDGSSNSSDAEYMSWPSGEPYQDRNKNNNNHSHATTNTRALDHQYANHHGYESSHSSYSYSTQGYATTTTAVAGELWNGLRHEVQKGRRLVETGVQAGVAWWYNNNDPKIPV